MLWTKIEEPTIVNELKDIKIDDFNIDRWHNYWMDVADPRGKYLQDLELYRMTGGGDY